MGKFENLLLCGVVLLLSLVTAQYHYHQPQANVIQAPQVQHSHYPTAHVQAHGQNFKLELIPSKKIYEGTSQQSTIHQGVRAVFQPVQQVSPAVHYLPPQQVIRPQIHVQPQKQPQPQIHYQTQPQIHYPTVTQVRPQPQVVAVQPIQQQVFQPQPQQFQLQPQPQPLQIRGTAFQDNTQAIKYQRVIRTCQPGGQCATLNLAPGQLDPTQQQISDATKAHATEAGSKCSTLQAPQQQQALAIAAPHPAPQTFVQQLLPSPQAVSPVYGQPPRLYDAPEPVLAPKSKTVLVNGEIRPGNRRTYPYREVPLANDPYNF